MELCNRDSSQVLHHRCMCTLARICRLSHCSLSSTAHGKLCKTMCLPLCPHSYPARETSSMAQMLFTDCVCVFQKHAMPCCTE